MRYRNIFIYIWVILNGLVGFALGWLISFGFFNVNNPFTIIISGFIFAGLHGWGWFRILKKTGSNPRRINQIKAVVIILQLFIVVLITGLLMTQRYKYQNKPKIFSSYQDSFHRLWQAIDEVYPYFEQKDIDWDSVFLRYNSLVREVKTDEEFAMLAARMLGELEDAHTDISIPDLIPSVYASVINRGDLVIVNQVGYSAEMAGLKSGMIILSVDGKSIEEQIALIDNSLTNAATPWGKKIKAYRQLLSVPDSPDKVLFVSVIDRSGNQKDIEIKQMVTPTDWKPSQSEFGNQGVEGYLIREDIGYIKVDRLWNKHDDIVLEFDQALDQLKNTRGLVLDLRQNGGGDSRIAEKIAGRFMREPFIYGRDVFKQRLYKFAWRKSVDYSVRPRGEIYQGIVVVLTDYPVMSSAEWLVGMLVDGGRAISIGRTTGGATGNPIDFEIPGGQARYSTAAFYRPDGSLVEGIGYSPNIPVIWTEEDYLSGVDPDIEVAIEWIEKEQ